jgi:hypothetical protein
MARLELNGDIIHGGDRLDVHVALSRRNLLTLLHKLDMPRSARELVSTDCWINMRQAPRPGIELRLHAEDDPEHYGRREAAPGGVHPDAEAFIAARAASDKKGISAIDLLRKLGYGELADELERSRETEEELMRALHHEPTHPDPATLDPAPAWVFSAHRWMPEEIGHELRLAYVDGGVCVPAAKEGWVEFGLWVDVYGNLILVSHPDFPRDYRNNLLAFLRTYYAGVYEQATGRSIEQSSLVQLLRARQLLDRGSSE